MGCAVAVPAGRSAEREPRAADLRGLSSEQINALMESPGTPKSVTKQIMLSDDSLPISPASGGNSYVDFSGMRSRTNSDCSNDAERSVSANFDSLGRELAVDRSDFDPIWVHPETGAKIYVGNETTARTRAALDSAGITHIVCCLNDFPCPFAKEPDFTYLHFPIGLWRKIPEPKTDRGMARRCAPLFGFVKEALDSNCNVLIHCLAGAHRGGTAGIACLMHFCMLDVESSVSAARAARPLIHPMNHLKSFLIRLEHSEKLGLTVPAIREASKMGYQAAAWAIFGKPEIACTPDRL